MSPLRRTALILSLAVTVALAAAWARSRGRADSLSLSWGAATKGTPLPGGPAESWDYRSRSVRLWHTAGEIGFSTDTYLSLGNDAAGVERWKAQSGWRAQTFKVHGSGARPNHWTTIIDWRLGRFACEPASRQGVESQAISAPHWFAMLLAATPAAVIALSHRRRSRRLREGRCTACGYPLGSAAVCPECGTGFQPVNPPSTDTAPPSP